ncbi:hypothetical protein LWM68_03640 [Niabella sp. W65]|nr:hypothetical protein [Niabella sp. W65]MCH7361951.1 hypothetical protein [Niabella sp. W65]ULT45707.1 hypothetical protein KRR40_22195 [Niabella sp. I65]
MIGIGSQGCIHIIRKIKSWHCPGAVLDTTLPVLSTYTGCPFELTLALGATHELRAV